MKMIESIPIIPNPRKSTANLSIGNTGSILSTFELVSCQVDNVC